MRITSTLDGMHIRRSILMASSAAFAYCGAWCATILFCNVPLSRAVAKRVGDADWRQQDKGSVQLEVLSCPAPFLVEAQYTVRRQPFTLYQFSAWYLVDPFNAYQISSEHGWSRR